MEEVKLIAGTILYFLGVIYFTECWFTQISILIGSILGLRCVLTFSTNIVTVILTNFNPQHFDRA